MAVVKKYDIAGNELEELIIDDALLTLQFNPQMVKDYLVALANNQRQWSSTLFKPLDMSDIPSYPRQMPPKYENWLPKFTVTDATSVEEHMSNFWAFFQLHPISDDAEDLVMKLFSATLYDASRR